MTKIPPYFSGFDINKILNDHPISEEFINTFSSISRDELRSLQEERFLKCVSRAWEIPFYTQHWGKVGLEPADIKSLDDIEKIPPFSKSDLMASIALNPPFGDFAGTDFSDPRHEHVVMHTTSGTTGTPQVLLFSPKTREIQNLLVARAYLWQGMKGSDVVHSVYGHGMVNAGHYMREAVLHFTNAIFCSAGTGVETRSVQQLHIMKRFGATIIIGFVDYIKYLAQVAKEEGLRPGYDIPIRMISGHFGQEDRNEISNLWGGAECFDWYGVGDTGIICSEGPDHNGMHIWEDAHYVEILDIDNNTTLKSGEKGNIVNTVLFKDDIYPMIRFNTHDVSAFCVGDNLSGLNLKRLEGIYGRSDNMIKLRGINVFPHGIGGIISERPECNGEFFCRAIRDKKGRDEMIVMIEISADPTKDLEKTYKALLKSRIGVEMQIEFYKKGELSPFTEVEIRQKPKRLKDERFISNN